MVPTTISISVSIRQEVHSLVSKFESTMTDDVQATPVTSNCWRDGPKSEILTLVLPPKAARFSSVNESPIVMQVVENKYSNVGDQQTFGLYPDRTVNLKQRNLIEICNSEQDFIVKCCFCFSRIICAIVKLQLRSALIHNRKVIQKKAEKLIVVSQCYNNQHRIAETAESRDKTFERANRCVSGISNYGQTCFLNSVLQALASLECFIEYLKLVETIGEEQTSSPTSPTLSETMLNLLLEINGERENKRKSIQDPSCNPSAQKTVASKLNSITLERNSKMRKSSYRPYPTYLCRKSTWVHLLYLQQLNVELIARGKKMMNLLRWCLNFIIRGGENPMKLLWMLERHLWLCT